MITDKNGNFFLNLGNNTPVRTFGPKELFGSNIEIHVDGSSTRDIFTDTGTTANINPSGLSIVNRINDISGKNRHFYLYGANYYQSSFKQIGTPSLFYSYFTGNTLDTNKGFVVYTSTTTLYGLLSPTTPSGSFPNRGVFSGTSALTLCTYASINASTTQGFHPFGIAYVGYSGSNDNVIVGLGKAGTLKGLGPNVLQVSLKRTLYTIPIDLVQYHNTYHMYTLTLTGLNYSVYIDNNLVFNGTAVAALTYPLNGSSGSFESNYFEYNVAQVSNSFQHSPFQVAESFITLECATPEKVGLLYDYFRRKYKN